MKKLIIEENYKNIYLGDKIRWDKSKARYCSMDKIPPLQVLDIWDEVLGNKELEVIDIVVNPFWECAEYKVKDETGEIKFKVLEFEAIRC